jgi:hypothetical protein
LFLIGLFLKIFSSETTCQNEPQFIWESGFREDFLEINQSERRMACGAKFVNGSELNEQS